MEEVQSAGGSANKVTVLELSRENLRDGTVKAQLLAFSGTDKNIDIKLTGFDIHSIFEVISTLERLSLRSLDLSKSYLTRDEFVLLMKELTHGKLSCLIFSDNLIECHDEEDWHKTFVSRYPNLPNLKVVELGGNPIYNHSDSLVSKTGGKCSRESYLAALNCLLSVTGFTFSEFVRSKCMGVSRNDQGELELNVMLDAKVHVFLLSENECEDLEKVRASYRKAVLTDAFSILQLGIEGMCLSSEGLSAEVRYVDLDNLNKTKALHLSFEYHPDAPLVGLLRRNSLYHFESLPSCQSLLYAEPLSAEQGHIYFLAHMGGKHAALVFECLTPDGQRVFECAHLTASIEGGVAGLFGRSEMQISYMKKNLCEFPNYIRSNYQIIKVNSNYQQCKALWDDIDHEMINGVDHAKYSKVIVSSSNRDESEGRIIMNCVRWALDKIKKHTGHDLNSFAIPSSYIPLKTLGGIVSNSQYRPGIPRIVERAASVGIVIQESSAVSQEQSATSSVNRRSSFWDAGNFSLGIFRNNTKNISPAVSSVKENFDELKCLIGEAGRAKKRKKGKVIKFSFSHDKVLHVKAVVESLRRQGVSLEVLIKETKKDIRLTLNFSDFEKLYPEKTQQATVLRGRGKG